MRSHSRDLGCTRSTSPIRRRRMPALNANSSLPRVRVPASTSNLGPGFDSLGLALALHLEAEVVGDARGDARGDAHAFVALGGTAEGWPTSRENVFLRAFDLAAERLGVERRARAFAVRSEIPIARGFGSSGAAVAAGLKLAASLARAPAALDDLLAWGLEIEGHPDNSSAALIGGCTLSVPLPDGRVKVVRQELHPDLGFALAWPSKGLATPAARKALPANVAFRDAVENPRRLALLLEGLRTADPELLALGVEDRLHVPYRLPLIPGAKEALDAARASGAWLATISGSGSGLFAIGPRPKRAAIVDALVRALRTVDPGAEGRIVEKA